MKFTFEPDIEAFRKDVRDFIQLHLPPEEDRPEGGRPRQAEAYRAFVQTFQKQLASRNWLALAWPKEFGGLGAGYLQQLAYNEEMAYAGAPGGSENMGVAWVGPALMLYGTAEQKQRFLPGITGVDDWWCTLYSEPQAGSDLASLQTRAVRDGDDFVISGQKIWTTRAHLANWGWLAARTDASAPKHRGISMFLVDMQSPGISVRPILNLAGRHDFNEVFFDQVRVPASHLVGEENKGWYHLAVSLDFERSSIGLASGGRREVEKLARLYSSRSGDPKKRQILRNELADRYVEVSVSTLICYQIATMQHRGLVPNKEASVSKVFGSELRQRIAHTRLRVLGMVGQLRNDSKHQAVDAATPYLESIATTIGGGTSEVNRGIIATRGLGLPRA